MTCRLDSDSSQYLVASGPAKYPFVRIGEGRIHRTERTIVRFRGLDHLPPLVVATLCNRQWELTNRRLSGLTADELPDPVADLDSYCASCWSVSARVYRLVVSEVAA